MDNSERKLTHYLHSMNLHNLRMEMETSQANQHF